MSDTDVTNENTEFMQSLNAGYVHERYKNLSEKANVAPIALEEALYDNALLFLVAYAKEIARPDNFHTTAAQGDFSRPAALDAYLGIIEEMTGRDAGMDFFPQDTTSTGMNVVLDLHLSHLSSAGYQRTHKYMYVKLPVQVVS